ncbi:MAG: hypothetical protein JWR12_3009 [Mucilaginibacter sp.]|nr:hypothetical protein [Mucilaginibacter sp.]
MINEATLEARLHTVLEKLFPTFREMKVVHQESFSIRFGHHAVKVDLKDPTNYPNRAIFDMLLTSGDLNIMLVELKREGHQITTDDIEQGLSYGRLINPMPPLVLISNGTDNRLFDTYTKEKIDLAVIDLNYIQQRINNNFQMSTRDFRKVVEFLLNRQPELIGKVFRGISKKNFDRQTGTLADLGKAISPEFQIGRRMVQRLYRETTNTPGLFGVIGPAFSGKTCILYQYFRNYGYQRDIYVLYIDLRDWNYSLYQQLANAFGRETKGSVGKDQVRNWITDLIHNPDESRLVILLDNLQRNIRDNLTEEITELIHQLEGSRHSIIYTLDEKKFADIAHIEGRNYQNIIGQLTKLFPLNELSNREFKKVNRYLYRAAKVILTPGSHDTSEFREPRVLRSLTAAAHFDDIEPGQAGKINSIPDYHMYEALSRNVIFTKEMRELYKKLAITFVLDKQVRQKVSPFGLLTNTLLAVSTLMFKKQFEKDDYKKLMESGIVVERTYIRNFPALIPKFQELIIFYAVDSLFTLIGAEINTKSEEELFDLYLDYVSDIPAGDVVGAELLNRIGQNFGADLFTYFIRRLLAIKPESTAINPGTSMGTFSERAGMIVIDFPDGYDEGSTTGSTVGHAILAQLVYPPLQGEDSNGERSFEATIELLYQLGSSPELNHHHGFGSVDRMHKITRETIPGWGEVLSLGNGIIETITQSMIRTFQVMPDLINELLDRAIASRSKPLLWRLFTVFNLSLRITDTDLAHRAAINRLKIQKLLFQAVADELSLPDQPKSTES